MGSLNIKNERAVRLITELAALEGKSKTAVVIEAVEEKLGRGHKPGVDDAIVQKWLDYGKRIRETADPKWLDRDQIAEMYDDELGLPR